MPENFDHHSWFYSKYLKFRRSYEKIWKPYLEHDIAKESCSSKKHLFKWKPRVAIIVTLLQIFSAKKCWPVKFQFLQGNWNCYLKQALVRLKIMIFYNFFFVTNNIGSETSQRLPNESPPQKIFQLALNLFILIDSAIICIYLRNTQLTISLKINAASLIRNTLAITLTNLLKQDLTFPSNTF